MEICDYCSKEYQEGDFCRNCFNEKPKLPPDWMYEKYREELLSIRKEG